MSNLRSHIRTAKIRNERRQRESENWEQEVEQGYNYGFDQQPPATQPAYLNRQQPPATQPAYLNRQQPPATQPAYLNRQQPPATQQPPASLPRAVPLTMPIARTRTEAESWARGGLPSDKPDLQAYLTNIARQNKGRHEPLALREHFADTPGAQQIVGGSSNQLHRNVKAGDGNALNVGLLETYACFDSRYRNYPSARLTDPTGLQFAITSRSDTSLIGKVGTNNQVVNVVEMEIFSPIYFPKLFHDPTDTSVNYYYFNEIYLDIQEADSQSNNDPNVNRHHFTFSSVDNGDQRLILTPKNSKFYFTKPMDIDKTLTFIWRTPMAGPAFDDDFLNVTILYANPAVLMVQIASNGAGSNGTNFTANSDVVTFDNFTSSTITYDSTNPVSVVYSNSYYLATIIDNFTFSIPLDFTNPLIANDINRPGDPTLGPSPQAAQNATFTFTNPIVITTPYPISSYPIVTAGSGSGLQSNMVIVIQSYSYNNAGANAALAATLTQSAGYPVTMISNSSFSIPVNGLPFAGDPYASTNILLGPIPGINPNRLSVVRVYVGTRRINVPIKFTGITSSVTNYLLPTQH